MGFLVALGVLGIFMALSARKGGAGGPVGEPGPDQILFEGRYWTSNELRGEFRRRLSQTPTPNTSMGYYHVAMLDGGVTPAWNRGFLDAAAALGLQALTTPVLDSWGAAMRELGMQTEQSYGALARYVASRDDAALIDPWADDVAAASPEQLEARADRVEADEPDVAEALRDVAEVRRAVDEEVPGQVPVPLAPQPIAVAPRPPAVIVSQPAAPNYGAMSQADLLNAAASGDEGAWAEIARRADTTSTAALNTQISQGVSLLSSAEDSGDAGLVRFLTRLLAILRAEMETRLAAPTTSQVVSVSVEPAGPAGYDPARARLLAPRVATAIRNAPYASATTTLVRQFQAAAFGSANVDGKYGGGTKGALRYYGVANPPAALYRPTAEVAYSPPA